MEGRVPVALPYSRAKRQRSKACGNVKRKKGMRAKCWARRRERTVAASGTLATAAAVTGGASGNEGGNKVAGSGRETGGGGNGDDNGSGDEGRDGSPG